MHAVRAALRRGLGMLALLGCTAAPTAARAQQATAGLGLSDGAPSIACVLYQLSGCPVPNPGNELFDRFQALSVDRTGGANSFRYARTGLPWDAVSTGGSAIGSACVAEASPPPYYGTPWIELGERYLLAARASGIDPLIAITTNGAARYPGNGNPNDPPNPTAHQYLCGFEGIVSTLDLFAASHGVAPPTEYETYDEPDGARVSDECNPTPDGDLPLHSADQCAAWYYYEADLANRTRFGDRLTLVALGADGDSANDPNLVAIRAYTNYLTGTIGLYPSVWSFHPYEDLSQAGYLDDGSPAHGDTTRVSAYIDSLYAPSRPQPAIWLTEAATQLTDPVDSYLGTPTGCREREAEDSPSDSLGGCLDGDPRAQAYAASDFLSLGRDGSAFPGQITRIYWHEFDSPANLPTTWDSGLISPGDRYERASYCVLSGESVADALGDPSCNSKAGAEASEASVFGSTQANNAATAGKPLVNGCPQPWCSFSLLRLRLSELGSAASPEPMLAGG